MFIIDGLLAIISTFLETIFSVFVILLVILEMLVLQIWMCKKLKEIGKLSIKEKIAVILTLVILIIIGLLMFILFKSAM